MAIPHWRYVRYTDDGSALYQCLNCYNYWDARSEPGHLEKIIKTDALVKGGWTIKHGDGNETHYANLAEPICKENWKFCPYCGIRWEGVIPHNCSEWDNERMLGERRLRIQRAMCKRSAALSDARWGMSWQERDKVWWDTWRAPPSFWWVIQERYVNMDHENWVDKEYAYGGLMPAKKMLYFLRERRATLEAENHESQMHGFDNETYVRLIVRRGPLPKPKGYEIRNYDPIQ